TGTTVSAPRMMNQFFRYWLGVGTAMPRTISPDARTRRRPADSALTRVYPAPLGVKGEPAACLDGVRGRVAGGARRPCGPDDRDPSPLDYWAPCSSCQRIASRSSCVELASPNLTFTRAQ